LEYDGVTELYGSDIIPDQGTIAFNFLGQQADNFGLVTSPANFGTAARSSFSASSGDVFAYAVGYLALPVGYVSGSALSATGIFDNTTLADLGLTICVYNYTWGTGNGAGSFQLDIGQSVREPAGLPLIAAGLAALAWVHRGRRAI
jgi:hypothetical protein